MNHYKHHRRDSLNNVPSFSSTLLDTIYRSIDEVDQEKHKTMKKTKHGIAAAASMKVAKDDGIDSFRGACFDDKPGRPRRKSMADFEHAKSRIEHNMNSCHSMQRQSMPRLVRTSLSSSKQDQKESGFVKTIKKVKQPISPGGKLASFLNSIFNTSSAKRSRKNFLDNLHNSRNFGGYESTTTTTTTCSSASSFSRSCLSKSTQSSSSNSRNNVANTKRSVRFCPVSTVIVDDGQKMLYKARDSVSVVEESRRVDKAAMDLVNKYKSTKDGHKEFEEDDDDVVSCASSDLFELDNLSVIGIDQKRYREELPVYETTHLDTNLAIAKGFIV